MRGNFGRSIYFEAEDFGLGEGEGFAVYFHETFAGLECECQYFVVCFVRKC